MFLSIVIPIYNDEQFLEECLDSCLNQDLSKDEYEIICVDDGSTDRTREILQGYASKYPNIRLMLMDRHKGGRTTGFSKVQGDYVWFVDHDDLIAPHAVDDLKLVAAANPDYDRIAFPYYQFFDELTQEERRLIQSSSLQCNNTGYYQDFVLWSSIIRKSFMDQNDILPRSKRIDEAGRFWGIVPFWVFSGDTVCVDECKEKGARTLQISERPLYYYRRHENAMTLSNDPIVVRNRNAKKFNTGLYWAYLAILQKQKYEEERAKFGKASEETAAKTFSRIREAVVYMQKLPRKDWKLGFKRMKQKDLFFKNMPDDYPVSFRSFRKRCSKVERFMPSVLSSYYILTARGAKWNRLLSLPMQAYKNMKRNKKKQQEKEQRKQMSEGIET